MIQACNWVKTGWCVMRQGLRGGWIGAVVLLAALMALPGMVAAQGGQMGSGDDRPAFAGGQMVRGTVTAAAPDHLTVKTDAGEVFQIAVSANTRVTKERQPFKIADVKVGDGVGAMGVLDAPTKTVHAVFVGVVDAEQVKKAREDLGKKFITGKVTAIDMDALKITVLRPDGVTQVIAVDEGTSFKRGGRGMAAMMSGSGTVEATAGNGAHNSAGGGAGPGSGESITLADVKVGDRVMGPGALKNGVFVPTELGVVDAAAMGQRRRRGAEGDAGAPASGAGAAAGSGAAAPAGSAGAGTGDAPK
jgi:hypothetical protein